MSFKYDLTANQQTPTSGSKVVLCKSFKIDIAAGSGFLTATTYDLGWLPKGAQIISYSVTVATAVSGGTVSAATTAIAVNSQTIVSALNVYATAAIIGGASAAYMTSGFPATVDQKITYTPTLTGAGATTGVVYITLFYVV